MGLLRVLVARADVPAEGLEGEEEEEVGACEDEDALTEVMGAFFFLRALAMSKEIS